MIIVKCPLRISLLGGGTDLPEVYKMIKSVLFVIDNDYKLASDLDKKTMLNARNEDI